jgi:hypothetical protein
MNHFLDPALTILHLAIILFNLTGWAFRKTRRAHLVVIGLTFFSWFIAGLWKGMGYCFLTDWHWMIKMKLGEKDLPASFITYMAEHVTGITFSPGLVDAITLTLFLGAVVAAVYVNFFLKKRK